MLMFCLEASWKKSLAVDVFIFPFRPHGYRFTTLELVERIALGAKCTAEEEEKKKTPPTQRCWYTEAGCSFRTGGSINTCIFPGSEGRNKKKDDRDNQIRRSAIHLRGESGVWCAASRYMGTTEAAISHCRSVASLISSNITFPAL